LGGKVKPSREKSSQKLHTSSRRLRYVSIMQKRPETFVRYHGSRADRTSDANRMLGLIRRFGDVEMAFRHLVQADGAVTQHVPHINVDEFQQMITILAGEGKDGYALAGKLLEFAQTGQHDTNAPHGTAARPVCKGAEALVLPPEPLAEQGHQGRG
jgi:hypothetical protein